MTTSGIKMTTSGIKMTTSGIKMVPREEEKDYLHPLFKGSFMC